MTSCQLVKADSLFFLRHCLVVAKLATVSALGGVVLMALFNIVAPPSTRCSTSCVCNILPRCYVHMVAFGCFNLCLIDPFFHGLALLPRLNSYRAFVGHMCCLLFRCGFLRLVTLIGDRRRGEDSPSQGFPTVWPRIKVLGL